MISIRETIVVEGKDDRSAVLAAVKANVLCTSGYGLNDDIISDIRAAYERTGIVIFTDPDHAGREIRKKLTDMFPKAKQAYLTKEQSLKKGDVGIENAKPEDIVKALMNASAEEDDAEFEITREDLFYAGLIGGADSAKKRESLGSFLGIGYANASAFLKRLNYMGITREYLARACERLGIL